MAGNMQGGVGGLLWAGEDPQYIVILLLCYVVGKSTVVFLMPCEVMALVLRKHVVVIYIRSPFFKLIRIVFKPI